MGKAATSRRGVIVPVRIGWALLVGAWLTGCGGAPVREDAQPDRAPQTKEDTADAAAPQPSAEEGEQSLSPPEETDPRERLRAIGAKRSLRAQEEIVAAQHYYEVGKRFFDQLEYQKAYDNLKRAVELNPQHQAAQELYMRAGALLGIRQDELRTNLERFVEEQQVKVQLMRQEMLRFYEAGEKAFNEGHYDAAIRDLERAIEVIAWAPYRIDTEGYRKRAEKLLAEAKHKRLYAELEERNRLERKAIDEAREQEKRRKDIEQQRVATMLRQAADLLHAQRYEEALKLAKQVLEYDPANLWARKYAEFARKGIHTLTAAKIYADLDEAEWARQHDLLEAATPQEGQFISYPDDWVDRTRFRRGGVSSAATEEPFWIRRYKQILKERKISVDFPGITLQDAIQVLTQITGLNFVISPDVDAESITITLPLHDITLENVLEILLKQANLTYVFQDEAILIVPPGSMPGDVYFEIYDVSDILMQPKDFTPSRISLPEDERRAGNSGGGASPFNFGGDEGGGEEEALTGERLVEIIQGATDEDAWQDPNQIEAHRGQLLVTATRELHKQVQQVLKAIRDTQGWFVHIEARFVEVENDMLEDLGVDFRGLGAVPGFNQLAGGAGIGLTPPVDKDGNPLPGKPTGLAGGNQPPLSPVDAGGANDVANAPNVGTDNFVFRTQHIFGNAAGAIPQGRRLRGGGGATLQVATLDDFQINAIIRAEAEQSKVRRMAAPRVTAANREQVFLSKVNQRSYIRDWELISGGTGLSIVEIADPVIDTFQDGVTLEVRPTISSDRKYVTLDLRPALSTLVGGQIDTVIVSLGSAQQAAQQVPIETPEITLQEAFTSVTVPDGGTALLGGFREINQRKEENSLPFVDNIPLLNLLFKRRSEIKETRSLVILVTAKIVSVKEEERVRFNTNGND